MSSCSNPSTFQIAIRVNFLRNKSGGITVLFMNLADSPWPKGKRPNLFAFKISPNLPNICCHSPLKYLKCQSQGTFQYCQCNPSLVTTWEFYIPGISLSFFISRKILFILEGPAKCLFCSYEHFLDILKQSKLIPFSWNTHFILFF